MLKRTLAILAAAFVITACSTVPIYSVSNAAVTTSNGKPVAAGKVRQAILEAGSGLGWKFADEKPGVLNASIDLRGHNAAIAIPYNDKSFSIALRSSGNLNESNGQIHKNYNGWIQNLERAINAKISALN